MTGTSYATRADRLPQGLCIIYEHGDVSGGLAWKYADGWIEQIADSTEWSIEPEDTPDHWGDSLVAIPRDLAEASTDPAVVAWVKSNINTSKEN